MTTDPRLMARYADLLADAANGESTAMIAELDTVFAAIEPPTHLRQRQFVAPEIPLTPHADAAPITQQAVWEFTEREPEHMSSPPHRTPTRGWISGAAALVAVLLIAMLAHTIFNTTPGFHVSLGKGTLTGLQSISMVSPDEGWAVGGQNWLIENDAFRGAAVLYHFHNGGWSPTYIPITEPGIADATFPILNAVSMVNDHDGWAVGGFGKGSVFAIILHYDGHSWRRVSIAPSAAEQQGTSQTPAIHGPDAVTSNLVGVQMLSATDGWAIADNYLLGNRPWAIFHYDGHVWSGWDFAHACSSPLSIPEGFHPFYCSFNALAMVSATEGWAVGKSGTMAQMVDSTGHTTFADTSAGIIYHFHNGQWDLQVAFPHMIFTSVTMLSAHEGWALGSVTTPDARSTQTPALYHYLAGVWQRVAFPLDGASPHNGYNGTITAHSATDVWVAVNHIDAGLHWAFGQAATLLHFDGTHWQTIDLPMMAGRSGYWITGISMISPTEGWLTGIAYWSPDRSFADPRVATTTTPLLLHFQNSTWSIVLG